VQVKQLKAEIAANEHEVLQLVATQNHLKRQQGSLMERIERLEKQVGQWAQWALGGAAGSSGVCSAPPH
jgi:hypothetical protein